MIQAGKFVVMAEGLRESMFEAVSSKDSMMEAFADAEKASSSVSHLEHLSRAVFVMQVVAEFSEGHIQEYEKPISSATRPTYPASSVTIGVGVLEKLLKDVEHLGETLRGIKEFEAAWVADSADIHKQLNHINGVSQARFLDVKEKFTAINKIIAEITELGERVKKIEQQPVHNMFSSWVKTSLFEERDTLTVEIEMSDGGTKVVTIPCPNGATLKSIKCTYDDKKL